MGLKLSKSIYNHSDLLFHAHRSWLSITLYWIYVRLQVTYSIGAVILYCDFQIVFDRMIPVRSLEEQIALAVGMNR